MEANWATVLAFVLGVEGGYVNNPRDNGGMTNLGITVADWAAWTKTTPTEADMRGLTPAMVQPLYHARYWLASRSQDMPSGVDLVHMDIAVNEGLGESALFLQRAVNVTADGIVGPMTMAAVARDNPSMLITNLSDQRIKHYRSLSNFDAFGRGWLARVDVAKTAAFKLVQ